MFLDRPYIPAVTTTNRIDKDFQLKSDPSPIHEDVDLHGHLSTVNVWQDDDPQTDLSLIRQEPLKTNIKINALTITRNPP